MSYTKGFTWFVYIYTMPLLFLRCSAMAVCMIACKGVEDYPSFSPHVFMVRCRLLQKGSENLLQRLVCLNERVMHILLNNFSSSTTPCQLSYWVLFVGLWSTKYMLICILLINNRRYIMTARILKIYLFFHIIFLYLLNNHLKLKYRHLFDKYKIDFL